MGLGKSYFMVTASKKRSNPWLHISDGLRRLPRLAHDGILNSRIKTKIFSSLTAAQLGEPRKPTSLTAFFLPVRWPRRQLITIVWRWTGGRFHWIFPNLSRASGEKCFKSTSARSDSIRGELASTGDPSRRQIPSHVCGWIFYRRGGKHKERRGLRMQSRKMFSLEKIVQWGWAGAVGWKNTVQAIFMPDLVMNVYGVGNVWKLLRRQWCLGRKVPREKLCKRRGKVIQFAPRYDRRRRVGKQIESTRITELIERKELKQIRPRRKNRKRAMRLCVGGIIKLRAKSLLVSSHFENCFRLTIATNTPRRGRKKLFCGKIRTSFSREFSILLSCVWEVFSSFSFWWASERGRYRYIRAFVCLQRRSTNLQVQKRGILLITPEVTHEFLKELNKISIKPSMNLSLMDFHFCLILFRRFSGLVIPLANPWSSPVSNAFSAHPADCSHSRSSKSRAWSANKSPKVQGHIPIRLEFVRRFT